MEKIADILRLAIQNEVKAKVFYEKASEITSVGESQMVFLELAHMEDGHARLLVNRFGDLLRQEGFQAEAYLQRTETETERVLDVAENELIAGGDMHAVVDFAIGLEVRARNGYRDLAARFTDADARAFCEDLAAKEQGHFDTLSDLRVSMDTPIDERPAL